MNVTEIRFKFAASGEANRLLAYATVEFDQCFVIRDVKVCQGPKGLFLAMPNRRSTDHCHNCHTKCALDSVYCHRCGIKLERYGFPPRGKDLYQDVAHPITTAYREKLQSQVLTAFAKEQAAISGQMTSGWYGTKVTATCTTGDNS